MALSFPPFERGRLPPGSLYLVSYPRSGSNWLVSALSYAAGGVKAEAHLAHDLFPHRLGSPEGEDGFWVRTASPWPGSPCPMIIKTHASAEDFANGVFPAGRVIFLRRDPRDALLSYYFFSQAFVGDKEMDVLPVGPDGRDQAADSREEVTFDPGDFARFVRANAREWVAHTRGWMKARGVLTLRYEDLKTGFEREIQRLLWAFGLPAARPLAETRRAYVEGFAPILSGNPRSFYRKGIVGDWKAHAGDPRVRAALDAELGPEVRGEFGYH